MHLRSMNGSSAVQLWVGVHAAIIYCIYIGTGDSSRKSPKSDCNLQSHDHLFDMGTIFNMAEPPRAGRPDDLDRAWSGTPRRGSALG